MLLVNSQVMFGFTTTDSAGVEMTYTRPLMQTLLMFVAMGLALPLYFAYLFFSGSPFPKVGRSYVGGGSIGGRKGKLGRRRRRRRRRRGDGGQARRPGFPSQWWTPTKLSGLLGVAPLSS